LALCVSSAMAAVGSLTPIADIDTKKSGLRSFDAAGGELFTEGEWKVRHVGNPQGVSRADPVRLLCGVCKIGKPIAKNARWQLPCGRLSAGAMSANGTEADIG
jgi:hypothetical protein